MPTTSMGMPAQYVPGWHNAPPNAQACPHCQGEGWLSDAWNWTKNAAHKVYDTVAPIARQVIKPLASAAANYIVPGSGSVVNAGLTHLGLGRPRRISARMRERNEVVRHVMKERSVPLGVASRIVKQEGLF